MVCLEKFTTTPCAYADVLRILTGRCLGLPEAQSDHLTPSTQPPAA
jgi:hypothetical protein